MVHLYLVRHGETNENVKKILQGHLPSHLNKNGQKQAEELSLYLEKNLIDFDEFVTSDLNRALETTFIINKKFSKPIKSTPLLRERDWGSLTGVSLTDSHIDSFPPDIESIESLFNRANKFIQYLLKHFDNKTILAVGHGLFNRCILAYHSSKTIQDIPPMKNTEIRDLYIYNPPCGVPSSLISNIP